MTNTLLDAVIGKEATIAAIKDLIAKFESGEISCAALRVFHTDGTWEDVAIGDDDDKKAEALAGLRSQYARAN